MSEPETAARFANRVADYVRYRPSYPDAVFELLEREGALSPASVVADVGAGTGIFTKLLAPRASRVAAIEPSADMRAAMASFLAGCANVTITDGTGEATGLAGASIDLVTVAQAFHWMDPVAARAEFRRILRGPGWVLLTWNGRALDATPFLAAYERLLLRYGTDYASVRHDGHAHPEVLFAGCPHARVSFPNVQRVDLEGLLGRARSSSYVPAPGQSGHDELMDGIAELHAAHAVDGHVDLLYDTDCWLGRLHDGA
jgi:SAM-dependent methyltransferase